MESFVLAGGQSTRMGRDKALMQLEGGTLLELALQKLRTLGGRPPRIVGSRKELSAYGEVIADRSPGDGPLAGIEAALAASSSALNLFLAVDLPLIPPPFLTWLLARAQTTGARVTIPRIGGFPQPLCAVYHRNLLTPVSAAIAAGNRKVMPVMSAAAPRSEDRDVFEVERVAAAFPDLLACTPLPPFRWFLNCNTPEDIAAMRNALVWSA